MGPRGTSAPCGIERGSPDRALQLDAPQAARRAVMTPRAVPRCHLAEADWKSVLSGKSVSVSVDLGGRRIIQTKIYVLHARIHTLRITTHTVLTTKRMRI